MALIDTRTLTKVYEDGTEALRGVSFSINQGEFVAIMGPSGSGKSTLLHILGFLDRQSSGAYSFDGQAVEKYKEEELAEFRNRQTGFVFQAFNLLSRTSVYENVKLPLYYSTVSESEWDKKIRESIHAVGLEHRMKNPPSQLSGGEKQRLAIARALVNNPNVMFADEPTGNLDSKSGRSIMTIIGNLHSEGRTIVVITHDMNIAKFAERTITLKDGMIESDINKAV
jgi:putative ABC transport system ATP-binding protein